MAIDMERAEELVEDYARRDDGVIELLLDLQEKFNYVPEKVLEMVSAKLEVPLERLLGAVTFYNAFSTAPQGRYHVKVCTGTACIVRGSRGILDTVIREMGVEPGETTDDGAFSLESVHCFGSCAHGPTLSIGEEFYGHVTAAKAREIVAALKQAEAEESQP